MGFFDGGGKVLSFGEVGSEFAQRVFGQWRGGVITAIGAARQATDINTRELKFWPNSQDPVMQLPITLDTSRGRCPEPAESADDDLVRDLYITKGKQMYAAARAALRKANAQDFEVGGSLYVRWASGAGKRGDARQFELYYEPPVASSGGFMNDPAPGQPAAPAMPPQMPAQPSGAFNSSAQSAGFPGPNSLTEVQHPSEVFAAAGGPPAQSFPAQPPHQPYPDAVAANTPPQPVFNQQTGQWEIPQPAAPAAPPTPPQPVFNQQTGQWEIPGQAAPQPPAPPSNGWTPPQQTAPAGPPPQAAAQPVGGPPQGVTNPFRR